jgi:membrane fusion protein (multidrug efflux system)
MRILPISLLLCIGLMSCNSSKEEGQDSKEGAKAEIKAQEIVKVKTLTVKPKLFAEELKLFGIVKPSKIADLIAFESGEVKKINVKEGQRVRSGQSLCSIDSDIQSSKLEASKIQKEIAESNLESVLRLKESGIASDVEVSQAKMNLAQAKQTYLTLAKIWRGSVCRAPFTGVVAKVHVNQFQNVQAGMPTITLLNDSKIDVEFGIPEAQYAFVKKGKDLKITSTIDETIFEEGSVTELAGIISGPERNYSATSTIKNNNNNWKAGQNVSVTLNGLEVENAIAVPTTSILPRVGKDEIFIVQNSKAKVIEVETIASNGTSTLIRGDLKLGDKLIVEGQNKIVDGGKVKVLAEVAQ